jgi:hypothetical protein
MDATIEEPVRVANVQLHPFALRSPHARPTKHELNAAIE